MVCLVSDFTSELKIKGFEAFQISSDSKRIRTYNRKGFYKICLYTGKHLIHYAERSYETNGTILFFGNPDIAYSCEIVTSTGASYACIFSEDFFEVGECSDCLKQSPLFTIGGTPFLPLNAQQKNFATAVFEDDQRANDWLHLQRRVDPQLHQFAHSRSVKNNFFIKMKGSSEKATSSRLFEYLNYRFDYRYQGGFLLK
ncbi:MAG: hypothetical protein ICV66_10995 [Chitinophagaceae bacterium]|nr:hypothetical protein [Chitinophagaceae bacterium]